MGDLTQRMEHQMKVVRMLQQMEKDAEHIYILGDLFDFWYEYIWPDRSKREYEPILSELRHITQDLQIPVDFYIGNHDIWTFGWLAKQTGMTVHRGNAEEISLSLEEKKSAKTIRLVVGHGDGLVPSDYMERVPEDFRKKLRGFIRLRKFFHHPIPQMLFRLLPPYIGNAYGYNWAKHSRLKEMAKPYPYKGDDKEEVVLWAKEEMGKDEKSPTIYIFGHRHVAREVELPQGSKLYLLGETFSQWTYLTIERVASDGSSNLASEVTVKVNLQTVSATSGMM